MTLGSSDLNLLNALRVLLEEVNVTRAGVRLQMSQPAMSGALARLRRQFNDELLVRNGRDHELTPLAVDLLPSVQDAVRQMNVAFRLEPGFDPATSERLFRIAASDYALSVVYAPLRARILEQAPSVRLEFETLDNDVRISDRVILDNDVLIGPMGYGFSGVSRLFFRDRIVCLVDRNNSRLHEGALTAQDLNELPHAVATFGRRNLTPIDRVLDEWDIKRHVRVAVRGWLALPFVVTGTDLVAMVPERLARRFEHSASEQLVRAASPMGPVDLVEGYWFAPGKATEPGHQWFTSMLDQVAGDLEKTLDISAVATAVSPGPLPRIPYRAGTVATDALGRPEPSEDMVLHQFDPRG